MILTAATEMAGPLVEQRPAVNTPSNAVKGNVMASIAQQTTSAAAQLESIRLRIIAALDAAEVSTETLAEQTGHSIERVTQMLDGAAPLDLNDLEWILALVGPIRTSWIFRREPLLWGAGGIELDAMVPCSVPWCDYDCRWLHDNVGGLLHREHHVIDDASGVALLSTEFPPGDDRTPEPLGIILPEYDNVDVTVEQARQLRDGIDRLLALADEATS